MYHNVVEWVYGYGDPVLIYYDLVNDLIYYLLYY